MAINLQDACFAQIKNDNTSIIIYLMNGVQLKGTIKGYDNFTVVLENEGKLQLIYKHAISTLNIGAVGTSFINEAFKKVQPQTEGRQ